MKKYEMIKDYRKSPKKVYENIGCIKGTHRERDENGEIICELDFEKLLDEWLDLDEEIQLLINEKLLHLETYCDKYFNNRTIPFLNFRKKQEYVKMARSNPENYIVVFIGGEFSREWYEFHIIAIIKEIDE